MADPYQSSNTTGQYGPKRCNEPNWSPNVGEMIWSTRRVGARHVTIGNGPSGVHGFESVDLAWSPKQCHEPYEHKGSDHPADYTPSERQRTAKPVREIPKETPVAGTGS